MQILIVVAMVSGYFIVGGIVHTLWQLLTAHYHLYSYNLKLESEREKAMTMVVLWPLFILLFIITTFAVFITDIVRRITDKDD